MRTTLTQLLGYPKVAKLLILNVDDLGSSDSANAAGFDSICQGYATSGSLMTPCRSSDESIGKYGDQDIGVHLTLNSDSERASWVPLTAASTLRNQNGCFHIEKPPVLRADLGEVREECREQISRALALGFDVTHLDSHRGTMMLSDELARLLVELGSEFAVPVRLPGDDGRGRLRKTARSPRSRRYWKRLQGVTRQAQACGVLRPDRVVSCPIGSLDEACAAVAHVQAGVTEFFFHPAIDSPDLRAQYDDWEDRIRSYEILQSPAFSRVLHDAEVSLIGYRQLRDAQRVSLA
jgi:predicted glycoside hydrolase/deacetylase ChbG (UPF0249 family)